jgi:hypothetical protein
VPGVEQRPRRTLRIARGAKLATFETIENAFGGEEAETALVTRDDPGGPVSDFDDIGFGHACSFAGMPALLSDSWLGSVGWYYAGISNRLRSPLRRSDGSCACAYRPPPAYHSISYGNPQQNNLLVQISDGRANWSMKWVSNFSLEARLPFSAARETQVEQSFVHGARPSPFASELDVLEPVAFRTSVQGQDPKGAWKQTCEPLKFLKLPAEIDFVGRKISRSPRALRASLHPRMLRCTYQNPVGGRNSDRVELQRTVGPVPMAAAGLLLCFARIIQQV